MLHAFSKLTARKPKTTEGVEHSKKDNSGINNLIFSLQLDKSPYSGKHIFLLIMKGTDTSG
jgi:hypothetical protein